MLKTPVLRKYAVKAQVHSAKKAPKPSKSTVDLIQLRLRRPLWKQRVVRLHLLVAERLDLSRQEVVGGSVCQKGEGGDEGRRVHMMMFVGAELEMEGSPPNSEYQCACMFFQYNYYCTCCCRAWPPRASTTRQASWRERNCPGFSASR